MAFSISQAARNRAFGPSPRPNSEGPLNNKLYTGGITQGFPKGYQAGKGARRKYPVNVVRHGVGAGTASGRFYNESGQARRTTV